uniref:Uncharacterized protein n=1 Tax=Tetranychus urticae TaxID=32264 RepID=T1KHA3_TETUR
MPRSILNLALEKELNGFTGTSDVPKDLLDNNGVESIEGDANNTEAKASSISSFGVFSESQLRDVTEVLEVQSRSLIRPSSVNGEEDNELCRTIIDSSHVDGTTRCSNSLSIKRDESKEVQQSGIESDHQEIRSASGLGESCSNSCYSTSSSSLPGNGSDIRENDTEAHLQPSSTSPSSPSSATVTVSTCPSCGSENVDPNLKSHRRYSTESYHQTGQQSNKWKSYSRPEIMSKSSHRSSPYKIKSNCNNSSFKQSSRHHHSHHHHGHHYGHHRLMNRPSKKHSLASELDMIRKKSKSKRDRYCSKSSSTRINSNDLRDAGRCHICKHDEDNRLSGLYPSIGATGLGRTSKTDCPYSLAYDDDHLMSHLCDIDSWHRRRKRETLKKKERAIIAILSIVAVLIFIAMSYFGTILFLRITTMPVS